MSPLSRDAVPTSKAEPRLRRRSSDEASSPLVGNMSSLSLTSHNSDGSAGISGIKHSPLRIQSDALFADSNNRQAQARHSLPSAFQYDSVSAVDDI